MLQVGKDGPSALCVWWRGGGRQPLAKHRLEEGAGSTEGWAAIAQTQEQELHLKEHSKSAEKEYGH